MKNSDFTWESITPTVAKEYLELMDINRNLRKGHVEGLARAMSRKEFRGEAGDPIRFTKKPVRLIDGQHRLQAIVACGKKQNMWVLRNCDPSLVEVIDQGRPRSSADIFALQGVRQASLRAAVAKKLVAYDPDVPDSFLSMNIKPTIPELKEAMEERQELFDSAIESVCRLPIASIFRDKLLRSSMLGFLYVAMSEKVSEEKAKLFFTKLGSMENLSARDPIYMLHQRLKDITRNPLRKARDKETSAIVIKAFNAHIAGVTVSRLVFKLAIDKFPAIGDKA